MIAVLLFTLRWGPTPSACQRSLLARAAGYLRLSAFRTFMGPCGLGPPAPAGYLRLSSLTFALGPPSACQPFAYARAARLLRLSALRPLCGRAVTTALLLCLHQNA